MSFLAEEEIDRVVAFAARQGKRRFAALIPDDAYGNVAEPAFRRAVQKAGGTVVIVERYPPAANGMLGPTKRVVEAIKRGEECSSPSTRCSCRAGQERCRRSGPLSPTQGLDTQQGEAFGDRRLGLPLDRTR